MLDSDVVEYELATEGTNLLDLLTPKQLEIELDFYPLRVACGARQWGKTTWSAVAHHRAAIPGATSLAIAPTVTKAWDLLLPGIEWLNKECAARIEQLKGRFQFLLPNGAIIQCMGMSTLREADKIRGFTPPFISIEECGVYHADLLQTAVESCAPPAQMKWHGRGGRGIALIGTPGRTVEDYWHQQCKGERGAHVYKATAHDNPHIPDAEAFIEFELQKNAKFGWTRSTPVVRREYYGEFCPDTDSLPYSGWNGRVWDNATIPTVGLTILSVDFGHVAPAAWVVGRVAPIFKRDIMGDDMRIGWRTHIIHAEMQAGLFSDAVAARTEMLRKQFGCGIVTGDPFGSGKQMIADLNNIYNVAIDEEDKRGPKAGRIWMGGSLLASESVVLHEDTEVLQNQMRTVPWNEDKTDHDQRYPDHALDAYLGVCGYVQAWQPKQQQDPAANLLAPGMTLAEARAKLAAMRASKN